MSGEFANIEHLADLVSANVTVIGSARKYLAGEGVVYWTGLGQVLAAIDQFADCKIEPVELAEFLAQKYGLFITAYQRLTKAEATVALALVLKEIADGISLAEAEINDFRLKQSRPSVRP